MKKNGGIYDLYIYVIWKNDGYSDEEMAYFKDFVERAAHLFFKFARSGGFENAAIF